MIPKPRKDLEADFRGMVHGEAHLELLLSCGVELDLIPIPRCMKKDQHVALFLPCYSVHIDSLCNTYYKEFMKDLLAIEVLKPLLPCR